MQEQKKYVTLKNDGCDFRKMAKIMSKAGYKMNHATARNQLILAIESFLMQTSAKLKIKISSDQIREMIGDQSVQNQLGDVLYAAHEALKKEEKEESNG